MDIFRGHDHNLAVNSKSAVKMTSNDIHVGGQRRTCVFGHGQPPAGQSMTWLSEYEKAYVHSFDFSLTRLLPNYSMIGSHRVDAARIVFSSFEKERKKRKKTRKMDQKENLTPRELDNTIW